MASRPSSETRSFGGLLPDGPFTVVCLVVASTKEAASLAFSCAWNWEPVTSLDFGVWRK